MEMVANIPMPGDVPTVAKSVRIDCVPAEKLRDNSAEKSG